MTQKAWHTFGCAVVLIAAALATPAHAEIKLGWYFFESNEPENKGRLTARLLYGTAEMDKIQVSAVCEARSSSNVRFSSVTVVADIGDEKSGNEAEILFSGGGFKRTIAGTIESPKGDGLKGIVVSLPHDDPLWDAFINKDAIDYLVPGYRAYALPLGNGRDAVKKFIDACKRYADQFGPDDGASSAPQSGSSSGSQTAGTDKSATAESAFYAAKDLDTIEAWDAYLASYPTGFHSELAKSYRQKLIDKQ